MVKYMDPESTGTIESMAPQIRDMSMEDTVMGITWLYTRQTQEIGFILLEPIVMESSWELQKEEEITPELTIDHIDVQDINCSNIQFPPLQDQTL